jgi:hypothetical protein
MLIMIQDKGFNRPYNNLKENMLMLHLYNNFHKLYQS